MIGSFCRRYSICLNIGFWQSSFESKWNGVISILVAATKKRFSSFLKKVSVLQEICFKVKELKTFETFTDCHIKTCWWLKRRALVLFFRRNYALSVGFKMKTLRKSVFECLVKTKNQLKFCHKSYWKKQSFIFTACLINQVFQTSVQ